jgi:hypothetical protein
MYNSEENNNIDDNYNIRNRQYNIYNLHSYSQCPVSLKFIVCH